MPTAAMSRAVAATGARDPISNKVVHRVAAVEVATGAVIDMDFLTINREVETAVVPTEDTMTITRIDTVVHGNTINLARMTIMTCTTIGDMVAPVAEEIMTMIDAIIRGTVAPTGITDNNNNNHNSSNNGSKQVMLAVVVAVVVQIIDRPMPIPETTTITTSTIIRGIETIGTTTTTAINQTVMQVLVLLAVMIIIGAIPQRLVKFRKCYHRTGRNIQPKTDTSTITIV